MIVRRSATHGKGDSGQMERGRSRVGRYFVLTMGAGVVSCIAALAGIPPFGSVQALLSPISQFLHPQQASVQIRASAIFPPVAPVHQTVDVYDPPPPAAHPAPQPSAKASPTPRHHSSPSPTPDGGD